MLFRSAHPGASAVPTAAAPAAAPQAPQLPNTAAPATPAPPVTATPAPPVPNVPDVPHVSSDTPPDPASLVQQSVSLEGDRAAASSSLQAEAATQSHVAPDAQAQQQAEVTPLGPAMTTTAHSADAPMASANASATSQGASEAATGRSQSAQEEATAHAQIASAAQSAAAERAQFAAMPPPPILAQTSAAAVTPATAPAAATVQAASAHAAAVPAQLNPALAARSAQATATPSTLPPFDGSRFSQIDQRQPLPPLDTSSVDEANTTAQAGYQQASAQIQQLHNIPGPQINAPAGPTGAKTPGGYPTREAAIAQVEQQVAQQGQAQAPAQLNQAAGVVTGQLDSHVQSQQSAAQTQVQAGVQTAQQHAQQVASQPPPVTGAQAAAQAQAGYQSHQAEATAAHTAMQQQIATAHTAAEGQVAAAKGQRDTQVASAQTGYQQRVQGQVMPQYQAAHTAANQQFSASNQQAQTHLQQQQTQAQQQADTQTQQAKAKADADLAAHQAQLQSQQQAAVTSHQQQVAAASAQHQAQMQQTQAQMQSQVAQHQAQMQSQVAQQQSQGQQQVDQHLQQGEQQYQQHIQSGVAQANAKKQEAQQQADEKKAEAEKKKSEHHGGGIFGSIIGAIESAVNALLDLAKQILQAACDAICSIMEAARAAAMAALNAARQAALAALSAVKSAIQGIISACASAIRAAIDAAAAAIKGLIQALSAALQMLVQALTTLLTTLVQAFQAAVNALLDGLIAAVSLVDANLGNQLRAATQGFRDAFNKACDKLQADIQAAGKALESGIQAAADAAIAVVNAAQQTLDEAVTRVEQTLNAAVDAAYQLGVKAINTAFDAAEAVVNTAFDVAEAAVKVYFEAQIAMLSEVQQGVHAVADFARSVADKVLQTIDDIAQAVVNAIPESWTKAFVDFWNGPWREIIIIGLATVAAVAITAATGGLGGPIAAMLLAGVIGGTISGAAYLGGEAIAREGDIKLSDGGKGIYIPGYGNVQLGPDGKPIPPPGLEGEKLADFEKQADWASSNFNIAKGPDGQFTYQRKDGEDIADAAVLEGAKGFGEGFISSAMAVGGGELGGAITKGLGERFAAQLGTKFAETMGGKVLSSAVTNIVTGPVQAAVTAGWETGFDQLRDGKGLGAALSAGFHAGEGQLVNPSNWAAAAVATGFTPLKETLAGKLGLKEGEEGAAGHLPEGEGGGVHATPEGEGGGVHATPEGEGGPHGTPEGEPAGAKPTAEGEPPRAKPDPESNATAEHAADGAHEPAGEGIPPETKAQLKSTLGKTIAKAGVNTATDTVSLTLGDALGKLITPEDGKSRWDSFISSITDPKDWAKNLGLAAAGAAAEPITEHFYGPHEGGDHEGGGEHGDEHHDGGNEHHDTAAHDGEGGTHDTTAAHDPASHKAKQVSELEPKLAAIDHSEPKGQEPSPAVAEVREARAEITKLKRLRTRAENGTGKWAHATPEQRANEVKLLEDQINAKAQRALENYQRETLDAPKTPKQLADEAQQVANQERVSSLADKQDKFAEIDRLAQLATTHEDWEFIRQLEHEAGRPVSERYSPNDQQAALQAMAKDTNLGVHEDGSAVTPDEHKDAVSDLQAGLDPELAKNRAAHQRDVEGRTNQVKQSIAARDNAVTAKLIDLVKSAPVDENGRRVITVDQAVSLGMGGAGAAAAKVGKEGHVDGAGVRTDRIGIEDATKPELWGTLGHKPMGQEARAISYGTDGVRTEDVAEHPTAQVATAAEVALQVASQRDASGVGTVGSRGAVGALEYHVVTGPDGKQVLEVGVPIEIALDPEKPSELTEVVVQTTQGVDVSTGMGSARKLATEDSRDGSRRAQISPDDARTLGDHIMSGEDALAKPAESFQGKRVLGIGGGPTSEWAMEHALSGGASSVEVAGQMPRPAPGSDLYAPLQHVEDQIRALVDAGKPVPEELTDEHHAIIATHVARERQRLAQLDADLSKPDLTPRAREKLTQQRDKLRAGLDPFAGSRVDRNFNTLNNGGITHVQADVIKVRPAEETLPDGTKRQGIEVVYADGTSRIVDEVVPSIGADPNAPGGINQLMKNAPDGMKMIPIIADGHVVGLVSDPPGITVSGAVMTGSLGTNMPESLLTRIPEDMRDAVISSIIDYSNRDGVSAGSRGIVPGIENVGSNPELMQQVLALPPDERQAALEEFLDDYHLQRMRFGGENRFDDKTLRIEKNPQQR